MASTLTRRPLPALVSLVALLLLTSLVWWRVLHRGSGAGAEATPCPSPSTSVSETLPAQEQVTVQVLNATSRTGIAGKARTALTADGFKSPKPATNDRPRVRVRGVAEIRYGPSAAQGAKLLAYYFPGAKLVPTASKVTTVVVSLGDKYKRVATPESVTAALTKDHVALKSAEPQPSSSPSC